ncbi:MAG: hypothetical protein ACPLX8_00430, partial [Nanopusillaceae archaeon]
NMTLKFDLPFLTDEKYIEFLNIYKDNIESVYFPLNSRMLTSARVVYDKPDENFNYKLSLVPFAKKYLIINARYNSLIRYDTSQVKIVMNEIKELYENNLLDGILFSDMYYLKLMVDSDSDLMNNLSIIPSINTFLDSKEKVASYFNYLKLLGISKYPNKVVLDRSLNRNHKKLVEISNYIRKNYPRMKIELVANEGCLYNCPFKINHDIIISLINDNTIAGVNYLNAMLSVSDFKINNLNQSYGCLKLYANNESLLLSSPFIRPEDLKYVEDYVDTIKIAGRTLGSDFIMETARSYFQRSFKGNLVELLDSPNILNETIYIDNSKIPEDFYQITSNCDKDCLRCNYCNEVIEKSKVNKPVF